jgi:hypothetical protein
MTEVQHTGHFWAKDQPDRSADGVLSLDSGRFRLELEKWAVPATQVKTTNRNGAIQTTISGDPALVAADHAQRVLFGTLDDGLPITLLDAHMDIDLVPFSQVFTGYRYVIGARIDDAHVPVIAIRMALDLPMWNAGWLDDEPVRVMTDAPTGTLSPWRHGRAPGFTFTLDSPIALIEAIQGIVGSLSQLVTLWTAEPAHQLAIQFQLVADGDWLEHSEPFHKDSAWRHTYLLEPADLTLAIAASWLTLSEQLGPLPFIATADLEVLQVHALVLSTALEGVHRRLHPASRPFHPLSKRAVRKAMDTARDAALEALAQAEWPDLDGARARLSTTLNHVDQMTYQERLTDLLAPVLAVAPGLAGPDPAAWISAMKRVRNDQSHQLNSVNLFYDEQVSEYYVLTTSGKWVLHLSLLLQIAPVSDLRDALAASQKFHFALANIDTEPYWPAWSALRAFRDAITKPHPSGVDSTEHDHHG